MKYKHLIPTWKEKYESGMSYRQIAKEINISHLTVRRTLIGHVETRPKSEFDKYSKKWVQLFVEEGWSKSEIAKKYNTTITIVSRILEKEGVVIRERKFEHLVKDMVQMYKEGKNLTEISKKLGVSRQTVLVYLKSENVQIRTTSERNRKFILNEHIFDNVDTPKKAYYLGLIFALGTYPGVYQTYALSLSEKEEKRYLIEELLDLFYPNEKPTILIDKDNICKVRVNSKHLQETLMSYGLGKKSDITFPRMIKEKYYKHFIKGYFIGRGSLNDRNDFYLGGQKAMILSILNIFSTIIPEDKIFIKTIGKDTISLIIYQNVLVNKVIEWLEIKK